MLNRLSKIYSINLFTDKWCSYALICIFLIICLFTVSGLLNASEPGLPFTEDFSSTNLKDETKTNANWSTEEQAIYLAWRKQVYGAFSDPDVWDISSDTDFTYAIALGDMDGDGDLDVVVGNWGETKLYLNNGSDIPFYLANSLVINSDTNSTVSIALGDMDGDGDLDVIAGNYTQSNRLYLNDGTGFFYDDTEISSEYDQTRAIALGDVDGDGDLDVVTGNNEQNKLYLNDGTGDPFDTVVNGSAIGSDTYATPAIALGDVDGDGDLDVVAGNVGGWTNKLYLNDGTGVFSDGTAIGSDTHSTSSIALGDVDGDGDLDVVAGNAGSRNKLYLNDGTGVFSDGTDIGIDIEYTDAVALGDVDSDGDLDLIAGNTDDVNNLYLNDGTGVFSDGTAINLDADRTKAIALGDLDGDRDLDLVVGNEEQTNNLYLNNSTENPFDGVTGANIGPEWDCTNSIMLGDMDGDDDLDVVKGIYGQNRLYLNDGTGDPFDTAGNGSAIGSDEDSSYAIALGDVDSDNDLDVVVGNHDQTNKLYLNNGTADPFSGVIGTAIGSNEDSTYAIALGDVDSDNDLDIVAGNWDQTNKLYLNDGAGVFSDGTAIGSDTDSTWTMALGDMDGDGDLDVVAGNEAQSSKLYLNNGTADPFNGVTGTAIGSDWDNTYAIALGDLNVDGDLDVVAGNFRQINKLYLNNGTSEPFDGVTGTSIGSDQDSTRAITLGDVDMDNYIDVIVGNGYYPYLHTNKLYLNNGTDQLFNGVNGTDIGWELNNTSSIALGDVDGDGDLDVVFGNYNEFSKLYFNINTGLIPDLFYDTGHGIVTSLEVDTESLNNISNATLTSLDFLPVNTRIDYFLSNNGGDRFYQVYPGQEFFFPTQGNDLRWRAELHSLSPALSPEIQGITITTRNIAPEATAGGTLAYTEDDPPTPIDGTITVTDIDNVNLEGATITISSGYQSVEDVLGFIDANGITGSWDSVNGVLTLIGTSSVENYQAALRSVTYENTDTGDPTEGARTIEFVVNDGEFDTASVTSIVNVTRTNDPPIITGHDPDPAGMLQNERITISINAPSNPPYVSLNVVDPDNIPDDLSLLIQSEDNYYVYGDGVTPVQDFFGELTVPIRVYDGIAFGDVYNLIIEVNDVTSPTVSSVEVQVGGQTVDVAFSEPMGSGVTTPANYTISDSGMGTLSSHPDSVSQLLGNTYRLTWNSGEMFNSGDIAITISGIQDAAGNPMGTPNSGTHVGGGIGWAPFTSIDNSGGTYSSSVSVSLGCSDTGGSGCAHTYYSTGGTDPTTEYTGPLFIEEYTVLKFFSLDAAGNTEQVQTEIYYIDIPTTISCNITDLSGSPITGITYGDYFKVSGSISPSPNAANEGIDIQLIPSSGPAVPLSTNADINGDFELIVDCNKIDGAGSWTVQTSWAGDESHLGADSDPAPLAVSQAGSSLTLDIVMSEAIKVNSRPPIGGNFSPDPACASMDLSYIEITLNITDPDSEPHSITAYPNQYGQFLLDYDESGFDFNLVGDWTISAEFVATADFAGATTEEVIVRVVPTAGYAIIVQGRVSTDEGMASHHKTASFVYEKLKGRQILDDDIQYLSWVYDSNVDKIPSRSNIEEAITVWARDKMDPDFVPPEPYLDEQGQQGDLYIIFIDHGWTDPSNDEEGEFYIFPDDPLTSTELSGWLSDLRYNLQDTVSADRNIIIILGFCRAGAFIEDLSYENRIIIASAAKDEASHRGPRDVDDEGQPLRDGEYFVSEFFKSVSYGKSIKECFEDAAALTEAFTSTGSGDINAPYLDDSVQHPLLDDNGDYSGSNILSSEEGEDGYNSEFIYIGASPPEGNDPGDVLVTRVNYAGFIGVEETDVDLWAEVDDPGDVRMIWLEIKAPNYDPDDPGAGFQIVMDTFKKATTDIEGGNRYIWTAVGSGSDPDDLFSTPGTYQVFYFAKDDTTGHVSPLVVSRVYKAKDGNNQPGAFNLLEPSAYEYVTTVLPLMWESSTDPDEGDHVTYTVEISESMDFTSFAFKAEGITDEYLFIDADAGLEDYSTYYWRVIAIDQYGAQTYSSETRILYTDNTNGIPGFLFGIVINSLGQGIGGASVETLAGSTTTHSNGIYEMSLPSGTFTVTVSAMGYETQSQPGVEIVTENYASSNFILSSNIDSDDDGLTDDIEAILGTDHDDADTDDDGILDGDEDANHNGVVDSNETDPTKTDTDGDGIQDGTEQGYTLEHKDADTDIGIFQPDLDPSTTTNPLRADTDGDGMSDGEEDINYNGRVDEGESDPNDGEFPWEIFYPAFIKNK